MRAHGPRDQSQSAYHENQHHQRMEQRRGQEIDMHVGDYAGQDKQRAGGGEQPSDRAAAVEEQDGNAEQQRNQRDAKTISAPEAPVRANDSDLVGNKIAANAGHDKAQRKFAQASGRAANIGH